MSLEAGKSLCNHLDIYLLRHGETVWNAQGRLQGRLDSPLTDKGRQQALAIGRLLADMLKGRKAVPLYASPLGRARQTAEIVMRFRQYEPAIYDPSLQEISCGRWEGLSREEIEHEWPNIVCETHGGWLFDAPEGEGLEKAMRRARQWLDGAQGVMIVVSHGMFGKLLRGSYLNLSPTQSIELVDSQDVIWRLHAGTVTAIDGASGASLERGLR